MTATQKGIFNIEIQIIWGKKMPNPDSDNAKKVPVKSL